MISRHAFFFIVPLTLILLQLIFALNNPFNYHPLHVKTVILYIFYIISLISLVIVYRKTTFGIYLLNDNFDYDLRPVGRVLFWILIFSMLIVSFQQFYLKYSLGLSFQELRNYFFFSGVSMTSKFGMFFLVVKGFQLFYFILFIFDIVRGRRKFIYKLYILISVYLLFAVSLGSRTFIYEIFILFMAIFISKNIKIKLSVAKLSFIIVFSLSSVILIVSRTETDFFEFLYIYLVSPVYFFSELIKNPVIVESDRYIGHSIMSLDWTVIGFYNLFFDSSTQTLMSLYDPRISTGAYLNDEGGINAFPTAIYYFALDFSYFFFVVIFISVRLTLNYIKRKSEPLLSIFVIILLFWFFIDSIRGNILNTPWFIVLIIMIAFRWSLIKRIYIKPQQFKTTK